ncbi:MAG: Pyridoxine 5'-phosphate synthase [Phycisphaerae bacterium]|nr:Pyridoxine 5'-phosphate synthase [Phycisphaerae bacterium]
MIKLGVNIDHVATVRQARRTDEPDPVWAAVQAELGGADGITVHLREDRRHIQDHDLERLRGTVAVRLNQELACADEILAIACRIRPDQATLVPEKREEVTTEGGLDVVGNRQRVAEAVRRLAGAGILVSLFIDPSPEQVAASAEVGAQAVELHTGAYAHAWRKVERATPDASDPMQVELGKLSRAFVLARQSGMDCHAGHGITYRNVEPLVKLARWGEFNIGHSIVARSLFVGLAEAVREMKRLMNPVK